MRLTLACGLVPLVFLHSSALAPGVSPVRIHYRDVGAGPPIVILHGGWGYEIYPFDRQIAALSADHRLVIPDRTGYGGSGLNFRAGAPRSAASSAASSLYDVVSIPSLRD